MSAPLTPVAVEAAAVKAQVTEKDLRLPCRISAAFYVTISLRSTGSFSVSVRHKKSHLSMAYACGVFRATDEVSHRNVRVMFVREKGNEVEADLIVGESTGMTYFSVSAEDGHKIVEMFGFPTHVYDR